MGILKGLEAARGFMTLIFLTKKDRNQRRKDLGGLCFELKELLEEKSEALSHSGVYIPSISGYRASDFSGKDGDDLVAKQLGHLRDIKSKIKKVAFSILYSLSPTENPKLRELAKDICDYMEYCPEGQRNEVDVVLTIIARQIDPHNGGYIDNKQKNRDNDSIQACQGRIDGFRKRLNKSLPC